jgi:hypothetical protein
VNRLASETDQSRAGWRQQIGNASPQATGSSSDVHHPAIQRRLLRRIHARASDAIAHGLEPSKFVISKDSASPSTRHVVGTFFYDYTVFIDGEHFTLTEPNDMVFLDYFLKLCTAEEDIRPLLKLRRGRLGRGGLSQGSLGLVRRFLRWMAQPV